MKQFKENFDKMYNGVDPVALLEKGSLSGGKNIRKVSETGGWKPRRGSTLLNTTAVESGGAVKSLHQYTNPRSGDYHLISQVNQKLLNNRTTTFQILQEDGFSILLENGIDLLLGEESADPLVQGADLGSSILASGVTIGGTPGVSCVVGETLFYADGSGAPIAYGGLTPYCIGFIVYDSSETAYVDYTLKVTDGRQDTEGVLGSGASDVYYVCSPEIAEAIHLSFGSTINNNAVTLTVKAWRAGAWVDTSASDGTKTTQTHDTNGSFTWTRDATDSMKVIAGVMGYWYQVSFSGALDAVEINSCKVSYDATNMTNKWDGLFEYLAGALFYDHSAVEYDDVLGSISSEVTTTYLDLSSAEITDFIYIKTIEPATAFGFGVVIGKGNTNNAQVDNIEYWNGNAWAASAIDSDETLDTAADSSFSTTGNIWINAGAITPQRRTFQGDPIAGYWYRVSWDAALSADTHIYSILYAAYPEALPAYSGVVEFQGRLFMWGDPTYRNRLRYSPISKPFSLSGAESGYTNPIGGADHEIVMALKLYEYLVVWKKKGCWIINSELAVQRVADSVGLASLKSAQTIEIGMPGLKRDELVSVAIWQAVDGVYVFDGVKPKKVSQPVNQYFNEEYSEVISADDIVNMQSFIDEINDEYHLLSPSGLELVYNYKSSEFYPAWEREISLITGLAIRGPDNRMYTYGGSANGFVMKLEVGTGDRSTLNAEVAIEHSIKTRAISAVPEASTSFRFTLRKIWLELKRRAAGSVTLNLYKNTSATATLLAVPAAISMTGSDEIIVVDGVELSEENLYAFVLEFKLNTVDQELEAHSFQYQVDAQGEISF